MDTAHARCSQWPRCLCHKRCVVDMGSGRRRALQSQSPVGPGHGFGQFGAFGALRVGRASKRSLVFLSLSIRRCAKYHWAHAHHTAPASDGAKTSHCLCLLPALGAWLLQCLRAHGPRKPRHGLVLGRLHLRVRRCRQFCALTARRVGHQFVRLPQSVCFAKNRKIFASHACAVPLAGHMGRSRSVQ